MVNRYGNHKRKLVIEEFIMDSIAILLGCFILTSFILSLCNTLSIRKENKGLDLSEIESGDVHSFNLDELSIDYDDDHDMYDCWLKEEHRHVYVKGKDVEYRLSDDQDVELYEVDGKEILVIYFRLNLEEKGD